MKSIVTGSGSCIVFSLTGAGYKCRFPTLTTTNECSSKVTVNGFGVVCQDDMVADHPKSDDCSSDTNTLSTYSSKVTINGKGVARIGDKYGSDNIIISGSSKIFVGGA